MLYPLNSPCLRSAADQASAPVSTAVPARLSAVGAGPGVDMGVVVHLWSDGSPLDGKALCGARPSGIFNRWQARLGEPVSCVKCLGVQAEESAMNHEAALGHRVLGPVAGVCTP